MKSRYRLRDPSFSCIVYGNQIYDLAVYSNLSSEFLGLQRKLPRHTKKGAMRPTKLHAISMTTARESADSLLLQAVWQQCAIQGEFWNEGSRLLGSIFYLVTVNWLIDSSTHYQRSTQRRAKKPSYVFESIVKNVCGCGSSPQIHLRKVGSLWATQPQSNSPLEGWTRPRPFSPKGFIFLVLLRDRRGSQPLEGEQMDERKKTKRLREDSGGL